MSLYSSPNRLFRELSVADTNETVMFLLNLFDTFQTIQKYA